MRIVFPTLHVRESAQATPLAAACLAAMLHDRTGFDCILLDLFPDSPPESIIDRILNKSPDLVVIPLYTWNRATMLTVSRELKRQVPAQLILGGGPEATADAAGVINEGRLDGAIRGEGEATFLEVVQQLAADKPLSLIPGLSLPQDGKVVDGPDRPPLDPDLLPSPWLTGILTPQPGGLLWEVARGCRFDCSYCFDSRGNTSVSKLPAKRLAAELQMFRAAGVSQVWALDSTFNFPAVRG